MTAHQAGEQHLGIHDLVKIYLVHWKLFLILTLGAFAMGLAVYIFRSPYVASTNMVFNDTQNSALQAFSSQFYGLAKSVQEAKKGNSLLSKHIEFLKTREFFEGLIAAATARGQSSKITLEEKLGFEKFRTEYLNPADAEKSNDLLLKLDKSTKFSVESDFEIRISVATPSREMSVFLANTAASLAMDVFKRRELDELANVENFISEQRDKTEIMIHEISARLAEAQSKDQNLLRLASKDKLGEYAADLIVRSNEIQMQLAENSKLIENLAANHSEKAGSSLYGTGGRISNLRYENEILEGKLKQVNKSIAKFKAEMKNIPQQAQLIEELKKKSDTEFLRFRDLSAAFEKLEAAKLSTGTRFDILDPARVETTVPQISLVIICLAALLLGQLGGLLYIYMQLLWAPHFLKERTSQSFPFFDKTMRSVFLENQSVIGEELEDFRNTSTRKNAQGSDQSQNGFQESAL